MLNFVLWFVFFFYLHTDKNIAVLSQLVFFALILTVLSKRTFDTQSIHIFGPVYYLSNFRNSPFYIRCYTYGKRSFVDYSRVRLQRSPGDSRSQFVIGIVRYKRNNVELPPLLKILQQYFAGSNSKGLSKSVLAIGSSSHRGRLIVERKKFGFDPGSFITL